MRRIICFALMAVLLLSACGTPAQQPGAESAQAAAGETLEGLEEVNVFPKSDCFIGDTMPFYEDGTMYVYYLADLRDGKTGYHPWALMTTQDYCTWEDKGIVIPYGEDTKDQDIALGTGCVMKDQKGLYHAFYTGHNDHYAPKEAIMHATSEDLVNWTKIWQFQAPPTARSASTTSTGNVTSSPAPTDWKSRRTSSTPPRAFLPFWSGGPLRTARSTLMSPM